MHRLLIALSIASTALIAGCSSNYSVEASFPAPLVAPLDLVAGLEITEEFENYEFVESEDDRGKLTLLIGPAQSELFRVVIGQMFNGIDVNSAELVIIPSIQEFQYAIPRETRANIYEVWMKYRIQVLDEDRQILADWLVNGYGKTPTAFLKSQGEALETAITAALRDVGAQLSIGFGRQPDIQSWLSSRTGGVDEAI